jgi:hypothetical protein
MTPASPISPELALVCPELAARARAAMPDRPWEMFVPRRPVQVAQLAPVPVARPHRWLRVASFVPAALLLAFAALLVVGSLASFGKRPSLTPASQPASVTGPTRSSGNASTARTWLSPTADRSTQLSRQP